MYNRYKGNGSRPIAVDDHAPPIKKPGAKLPPGPVKAPYAPKPTGNPLGGIIPKGLGELETEDLLLLLILYLMYRESGDKELLMILGAMLFL